MENCLLDFDCAAPIVTANLSQIKALPVPSRCGSGTQFRSARGVGPGRLFTTRCSLRSGRAVVVSTQVMLKAAGISTPRPSPSSAAPCGAGGGGNAACAYNAGIISPGCPSQDALSVEARYEA